MKKQITIAQGFEYSDKANDSNKFCDIVQDCASGKRLLIAKAIKEIDPNKNITLIQIGSITIPKQKL